MSDQQPLQEPCAQHDRASAGPVSRRAFLSGTAAGMVAGGALAYGGLKSALAPPTAAGLPGEAPLADRDHAADVAGSIPTSASNTRAQADPRSVELIVAQIQERYPHEKLDGSALDLIRLNVAGQLRRSRVLSSFPLEQGDRPALVFTPFVVDDEDDS